MAVRRRRLYPDTTIDTAAYGPVDYVSDQTFLEAVLAAAQTVALAGGVLTVLVERAPTDLPQEMVTTGAVIEWKDRTNAKAQPEPTDAAQPKQDELAAELAANREMTPMIPDGATIADVRGQQPSDDVGDGLDPRTLEEEDVSSIPVGQR